jgi:general stress protein CsbA
VISSFALKFPNCLVMWFISITYSTFASSLSLLFL